MPSSVARGLCNAKAEKAGELRRSLDDPRFPGVTYRRGAAGIPTPEIRGTGIRVQTIVIALRHWKLSPHQIAEDYDLANRQVEECLAFYAAHQAEMDAAMEAEERIAAAGA